MNRFILLVVCCIASIHSNHVQRDDTELIEDENEELKDLKSYEKVDRIMVVLPDDTEKHWKPNKKDITYEDPIELAVYTTRDRYHLQLHKNKDIFHPDFILHVQDDDPMKTITKRDLHDCHYQGNLKDDESTKVSMSTCDGYLTGSIISHDGTINMKPVASLGDVHIIYNSDDEIRPKNKIYHDELQMTQETEDDYKMATQFDEADAMYIMKRHTKYITMAVVVDNKFHTKRGSDMKKTSEEVIRVINRVDMIYKTVNIRVALVSLEIWNVKDMFNVTKHAGTDLSSFERYNLHDKLIKRKERHDAAAFLTGVDLKGSVVGLAEIGSICHGDAALITQDLGSITANTLGHELGHNLGLYHISGSCVCSKSSSPCLMTSTVSWSHVKGLADCSVKVLAKRDNAGSFSCMYDLPKKFYNKPVCGNGFLEKGEHCDCGTVEECTDKCCNALTCQLAKHAECSSGECCENCKIKAKGVVCRKANNECELDDYCTGKSFYCPENRYKRNGVSCRNGKGYCLSGVCGPSYDEQCKAYWGANGANGNDWCYGLNKDGDSFANCGKIGQTDTYRKCKPENVNCGKLQCAQRPGLSRFPLVGRYRGTKIVRYGSISCRMGKSKISYDMKDPSQVKHGSKCGDGKICYESECVDVTSLYGTQVPCKETCLNGGVCNNEGDCHCLPGYTGVNCGVKKPRFSCGNIAIPNLTTCRSGVKTGTNGFKLIGNYRNAIDWKNYPDTVNRMICDCANAATALNYTTFGIQYWGECWATKDSKITDAQPLGDCYNANYKPCTNRDAKCVGDQSSIFLYTVE